MNSVHLQGKLFNITIIQIYAPTSNSEEAEDERFYEDLQDLLESESEVVQSCPTLCDPVDCSLPDSSVHGILQARILDWVAISFSGDLPNPGIKPKSPALQADALTSEPSGKQDLLELTPKKDVLFIIGDWTAKVGSQETPGVTGKFVLGVQNEAGQRLIEFCQENTLVIANTLFQQHKRRLYTWT